MAPSWLDGSLAGRGARRHLRCDLPDAPTSIGAAADGCLMTVPAHLPASGAVHEHLCATLARAITHTETVTESSESLWAAIFHAKEGDRPPARTSGPGRDQHVFRPPRQAHANPRNALERRWLQQRQSGPISSAWAAHLACHGVHGYPAWGGRDVLTLILDLWEASLQELVTDTLMISVAVLNKKGSGGGSIWGELARAAHPFPLLRVPVATEGILLRNGDAEWVFTFLPAVLAGILIDHYFLYGYWVSTALSVGDVEAHLRNQTDPDLTVTWLALNADPLTGGLSRSYEGRRLARLHRDTLQPVP